MSLLHNMTKTAIGAVLAQRTQVCAQLDRSAIRKCVCILNLARTRWGHASHQGVKNHSGAWHWTSYKESCALMMLIFEAWTIQRLGGCVKQSRVAATRAHAVPLEVCRRNEDAPLRSMGRYAVTRERSRHAVMRACRRQKEG